MILAALVAASLESFLTPYEKQGTIAAAIVQDGKVVALRNPDTAFRMASLSKVVTAYAVVGSGADLHAPTVHGRVTLHHLLTHTSGIDDRVYGNTVPVAKRVTLSEHFREHPPRFGRAAGDTVVYSNEGITLAGYLIAGDSFERYVAERVFGPLGMTGSTFVQPPPFPVVPSGSEGERLVQAPAGAMTSTAADMARLMIALLSDDPATRLMREKKYGLFEFGGALFHTGRSGHESVLYLVPAKRLGLFLVHSGGMGRDIRLTFVRQFAGWDAPPRSQPRIAGGTYRPILFPRYRIERMAALVADTTVTTRGNIITARMPPLALGETRTFTGGLSDKGLHLSGSDDRFTITGPLTEPMTFMRIPWYATGRVHLLIAFSAYALIAMAALQHRLFALVAALFALSPLSFFASYLPRSAETRPFAVDTSVRIAVAILMLAVGFAMTTPLVARKPLQIAAAIASVMLGAGVLWWVV